MSVLESGPVPLASFSVKRSEIMTGDENVFCLSLFPYNSLPTDVSLVKYCVRGNRFTNALFYKGDFFTLSR